MNFKLVKDNQGVIWAATKIMDVYDTYAISTGSNVAQLNLNEAYRFFYTLKEHQDAGNLVTGWDSMLHDLPVLATLIPNKALFFDLVMGHTDAGFLRALRLNTLPSGYHDQFYPNLRLGVTEEAVLSALRMEVKFSYNIEEVADNDTSWQWHGYLAQVGILTESFMPVGLIMQRMDQFYVANPDRDPVPWKRFRQYYNWLTPDFRNILTEYLIARRMVTESKVGDWVRKMAMSGLDE